MANRTCRAVAGLTLALVACGAGAAAQRAADHELARFERRVTEYVELHRRVAAAFPPRRRSGDAAEAARNTDGLFAALIAARPRAAAGDIFDAAAGDAIRAHVADTIAQNDYDAAVMLRALRHAHGDRRAVVNQRFPWGGHEVTWPSILWALPPLPPELEYRFVGRDLVLLDAGADLVVDVLAAVLPLS